MSLAHLKRQTSLLQHPAIYTDFYELTMAQGYFLAGRKEERASFDYFFRDIPFDGGYVIFAGLSDLIELLGSFQFHEDELDYLSEQGFRDEFVRYLRDFRLNVDMMAPKEGEIVFPYCPVLRVEGTIIEAQVL